MVSIGDEVEAVVLTLDKDKKRISLGMKQIEPNPWEKIEDKYPIGSEVEGTVRNLTDFGAFVELEDGVDGLIHISDLSWKKIKHPSEVLKKKDKISSAVLSIDKDNCRISLGVKQLQPDPWDDIAANYPIGTEVSGKIIKVTGFGAFAEFGDGLEGLIHVSQLSSENTTDPESAVQVDDDIKAKVIKVDTSNKKIALSIKALILKAIFLLEVSTLITFALISSSTWTADSGSVVFSELSCETWMSPSSPSPNSANAPNPVTLIILPLTSVPIG